MPHVERSLLYERSISKNDSQVVELQYHEVIACRINPIIITGRYLSILLVVTAHEHKTLVPALTFVQKVSRPECAPKASVNLASIMAFETCEVIEKMTPFANEEHVIFFQCLVTVLSKPRRKHASKLRPSPSSFRIKPELELA